MQAQTVTKVHNETLQLFETWHVARKQLPLQKRRGVLQVTHRPLVFIDIETTGGTPNNSRITEIGAIRVENGRIVQRFSKLINPSTPIPYYISHLTGITDAMVRDAPSFADVADDLLALLDGAIFIAHHVDFDYGFIKHEFAQLGRSFNMDRLCSVKLDRRLHPEQARHGLDRVIERMGVTIANRHRAYDDAEVIYKLFQQERSRDSFELFRSMQKLLVRTK